MAESQSASVFERSNAFGADRLPISLLRCVHRRDFPLHRHGFSELAIVLGGTGLHATLRGESTLAAGDIVITHPGQVHGYRQPQDLALANVAFVPAELHLAALAFEPLPGYGLLFLPGRSAGCDAAPALRLRADGADRLLPLIDSLEAALADRAAGRALRCTACFMLLVAEVCRSWSEVAGGGAREVGSLGPVLALIEREYAGPLTLGQMAEAGSMSVRSLSRAFHAALGRSPVEHLGEVRLRAACELLQTSDASIGEVALRCGFPDGSYFARRFRAATGVSPLEFRRRRRTEWVAGGPSPRP